MWMLNVPAFSEIGDVEIWPSNDAEIDVPVLVLLGSDDPIFVPDLTDEMDRLGPKVNVIELDGAGHWVGLRKTEEVNEALLQFLSTVQQEVNDQSKATRKLTP